MQISTTLRDPSRVLALPSMPLAIPDETAKMPWRCYGGVCGEVLGRGRSPAFGFGPAKFGHLFNNNIPLSKTEADASPEASDSISRSLRHLKFVKQTSILGQIIVMAHFCWEKLPPTQKAKTDASQDSVTSSCFLLSRSCRYPFLRTSAVHLSRPGY